MNERGFADELIDALESTEAPALLGMTMRSFAAAGLVTTDTGIVVRLPDGSEYQVTIVQSKEAR